MTEIALVRGDATLRGTATGTGPTVLLLHAGGEHRGVWTPVAAPLAQRGLRTVAFDLRGHGASPGPATTLRAIAEDVTAMIRREPAPVVVVGASLGGLAAIAALADPGAARHVAGLVLVDVVPDPDPPRTRAWLDARGLRHDRAELVEDILQRGPELLTTATKVDLPILLVRGGRRSPLSDADVGRFRDANPSFSVSCVPAAGHLVARDAPEELARIVADQASTWLAAEPTVRARRSRTSTRRRSPRMTTDPRPLVDYDTNAQRYRRGRDLTGEQLERWRTVVADRLPDGPLALVVDAGAGTGAFLPMWEALGARRILAVEPSTAMRAAATDRGTATAQIVAGNLNAIPAASATTDVVWLSAVLHHVVDRRGAFVEIARVLRPRGRLLLRGFVPGSSRVPWLEHFPGAERASARFPGLQDICDLADQAGLRAIDVDTVHDTKRVRPAQAIAWISEMRNADSLLTALTDDEIAAGTAALRALPDEPLDPLTLDLVTIERP